MSRLYSALSQLAVVHALLEGFIGLLTKCVIALFLTADLHSGVSNQWLLPGFPLLFRRGVNWSGGRPVDRNLYEKRGGKSECDSIQAALPLYYRGLRSGSLDLRVGG